MNYKLAVFDVDGTLVTHRQRVLLDSTIESILSLQKQGIKVAIATGRAKYSLERSVLERVHFDFFINSNGALIYDNRQHCILEQYKLSHHQVERFSTLAMQTNSSVLVQFTEHGFAYWGYDRLSKMLDDTCGRHDFISDHSRVQNHHLKEIPHTFIAHILPSHIEMFRQAFPEFEFLAFLGNFYDILPKPRNKAYGVEVLCDHLGIDMQQVIAFGDGSNDLEMLQAVGLGIAMGNALDVVKRAAKEVTADTDQHGIYLALLAHRLVDSICID